MVMTFRYLDLFWRTQIPYLVFMKLVYIAINCAGLMMFSWYSETYESRYDRCNILLFLIMCIILTAVVQVETPDHFAPSHPIADFLWTFSELLEPFAIMPQLIMCLHRGRTYPSVFCYISCLAGY